MEEGFKIIAESVALLLEATVVAIVLFGALEALYRLLGSALASRPQWSEPKRAIWLRFAAWILLALEFALGADIVRTAIAPTWDDIGQLAAIAGIRTVLSFFLDRDVETIGRDKTEPAEAGQ